MLIYWIYYQIYVKIIIFRTFIATMQIAILSRSAKNSFHYICSLCYFSIYKRASFLPCNVVRNFASGPFLFHFCKLIPIDGNLFLLQSYVLERIIEWGILLHKKRCANIVHPCFLPETFMCKRTNS